MVIHRVNLALTATCWCEIADMRRVLEIFTNPMGKFPVTTGEVDEVVTIWSEVVYGEALYRIDYQITTDLLLYVFFIKNLFQKPSCQW